MSVARVTEIIAGSKKSFEDAIEKGIARAVKTLKNVECAAEIDTAPADAAGQMNFPRSSRLA